MLNYKIPAMAVAVLLAAAATGAQAQSAYQEQPRANGITNCDAPGGRQQAGAAIGGVIGDQLGKKK